MGTRIEETDGMKILIDEFNPRIYTIVSYKCVACRTWVNVEDAVWHENNPYHVFCCPPEKENN